MLNKEKLIKILFMSCAFFSVISVLLIIIFIFASGVPAIREIGLYQFLLGAKWYPERDIFGILPMIIASIYVTAGAIVIGLSVGLFSAVYISCFMNKKTQKIISQFVNLLAGIPSVIYGFFGIVFLIPLLNKLPIAGSSYGILGSSIILGIMILPTIISLSVTSLKAVEKEYYEGAISLGASKEQVVFKVILPKAKSGILASIILAIGRAIGETMAVIMVAGNSPVFPKGLFTSIRTMTANIVLEMSYASHGSLHMGALVGTGVVLFVFIMIFTTSINLLRNSNQKDCKERQLIKKSNPLTDLSKIKYIKNNSIAYSLKIYSLIATVTANCLIILIIGFITIKGLPNVTAQLLWGDFSYGGPVTILPAIVTTIMLILIALLICLPLGTFAAIYLNEYTNTKSRSIKIIRQATETLAGIPSIIYGLFGMLFFVKTLNMGYSILAGGLTLVIMILPTILRATEEALKAVPLSFREGSYALGASKSRTIFKVVLPNAIGGITAASILAIGRIVGESAALIFTAGSVKTMPKGVMSAGSSLAVMMFSLAVEGMHMQEAYGTAFVLIIIIIFLNIMASFIEKKYKKGKAYNE